MQADYQLCFSFPISYCIPNPSKNRPLPKARGGFLSVTELAVVKIGIKTILFHQFLMISLFDDRAILHHQNHIRALDCGKPVGNDKAGSTLHHSAESILNFQLCTGIDGRCCFIQYQHGRQFQHRPGNTQQLPLTGREISPFSAICVSYPLGSLRIKLWA